MDSDEGNLLVLFVRWRRRRRRKQQRLLWMHPLTVDRLTSGQFYTIMTESKQDSCKFHCYFRMSKNSFDELLSLLKTLIGKADTNMKKSIPAEERLAITIRKNLHKRWTHKSAETQHGFLPLMMQGIDPGRKVDYHQIMSAQMHTGRCTDEFEGRRMGEIRYTRLQEVLCLCSDSGEMATEFPLPPPPTLRNESQKLFHRHCRSTAEKKNTSLFNLLLTAPLQIYITYFDVEFPLPIAVCETIWQHLHDICFPNLTEDEWLKIANGFETLANFPNCLGAIDAVYNSNYRFTFVNVGSYGKASDLAVYQNSLLFQRLKVNALHIPSDKPMRMGGEPLPFTFFGILKNKWRIFHRALNINVNDAATLVKAANMRSALKIRENGQAQADSSSRYHTPPKVARVQEYTGDCVIATGGGDKPQSAVCKHFRLYNARLWDTTTQRPSGATESPTSDILRCLAPPVTDDGGESRGVIACSNWSRVSDRRPLKLYSSGSPRRKTPTWRGPESASAMRRPTSSNPPAWILSCWTTHISVTVSVGRWGFALVAGHSATRAIDSKTKGEWLFSSRGKGGGDGRQGCRYLQLPSTTVGRSVNDCRVTAPVRPASSRGISYFGGAPASRVSRRAAAVGAALPTSDCEWFSMLKTAVATDLLIPLEKLWRQFDSGVSFCCVDVVLDVAVDTGVCIGNLSLVSPSLTHVRLGASSLASPSSALKKSMDSESGEISRGMHSEGWRREAGEPPLEKHDLNTVARRAHCLETGTAGAPTHEKIRKSIPRAEAGMCKLVFANSRLDR
ncbi:hypothetical protein PR048_019577 [Dryococelus australis]|uniref:Uncharacterized protein n=1 Tax=Dryococelus australis TaxID=614101 RepID=A0ABQ9H3U6_9NEOP|nr:hypothetical protein PR048_019577 [Dryococelus australis]